MSHTPFKVKPVKRYGGARYHSEVGTELTARACWLSAIAPAKLVRGAVTLLLAASLALGVMACGDDTTIHIKPGGGENVDGDTDSGESGGTPPPLFCLEEGLIFCADEDNVWSCENGLPVKRDCDEVCREERGSEYYSIRCDDDDPEDLCRCTYDIMEGEPAECVPGDLRCRDIFTAETCSDGYYEAINCDVYCQENYGWEYYSIGCDNDNLDNACQCQYGMTDGEGVQCEPGDVQCRNDNTAKLCPNYSYVEVDCDLYCQQTYGSDYYSMGCDANTPENVCLCEYGVTDGEPAECQPGEAYCIDNDEIAVCSADDYSFHLEFCSDYCRTYYGNDYYSTGCYESNYDNPCGCEYDIVDGDIAECYVGEEACAAEGGLLMCIPYGGDVPEGHEGEAGMWESISCDSYCVETYGDDYYSPIGCQADDPDDNGELCSCEYGALDGVAPNECLPDEAYCDPDDNLVACDGGEGWGYWVTQNCTDACAALDPPMVSTGCDAENADNPCLCAEDEDR